MARRVLTDASPLIGLSRVDGLGWLKSLFDSVWMPEAVRREVLPGSGRAGESAIQAALDEGWLLVLGEDWDTPAIADLDEGEAACIRAAINSPDECLLLIDERAGRAVAAQHGLRVVGTAALVAMTKQRGLIPSAKVVFERLHQAGFRIAPEVIRTVLERVGEA